MTAASRARAALLAALPPSPPGLHLAEAEIADFHRDRLDPEARERAIVHLVGCRECSRLVLAFADFDAPEAALPLSEFEAQAAWRLVRPGPGFESSRATASRAPRPLLWQALAASLLITTLAASFHAQRLGRDLARAGAPQVNTPVVDLFATGVRSASPEPKPLPLAAGTAALVVVLNPERRDAFPSYALEVRSAPGELLWQADTLEKNRFGSFTVTLPRPLLESGPLSFSLFGRGEASRELLGTYRLEMAFP